MRTAKKILDYQRRILDVLPPCEYVKIDDVRIDCYAGRFSTKSRIDNFEHALRDLIATGRIILCGNSIKLRHSNGNF